MFFKNIYSKYIYIYIYIYIFFSTGLVQLIFAGLPLRSCLDHWTTFCGGGGGGHMKYMTYKILVESHIRQLPWG